MPSDAFTEPMLVLAVEGEVVVLGPNGVNGAFTIEAARISARNLLEAADEANAERPPPDDSV